MHIGGILTPKSAKIMDIAAGTGLASVKHRQDCFSGKMDTVDGCQAMLDKARERRLYTELISGKLGDGSVMPVGDNKCTFDHLLQIAKTSLSKDIPLESY